MYRNVAWSVERLQAGSRMLPSESRLYMRPHGGLLKLTSEVMSTLARYVQAEPLTPEAGGILLGRHLFDCAHIVVDEVTTPQKGDRQKRFSFFRSRKPHQQQIDRAWRASNGTCTYLGEWHTHPEPHPTPSAIDWQNWRQRLHKDRYTPPLFFIIVGTSEVAVWQGTRDEEFNRLHQLSQGIEP